MKLNQTQNPAKFLNISEEVKLVVYVDKAIPKKGYKEIPNKSVYYIILSKISTI